MKKIILSLFTSFIFASSFPVLAQVSEYSEFNPKASIDFNANLNVNDLAIAVDRNLTPKIVRIFQKKDGLYLVGNQDLTDWEMKNQKNSLKWYKANSIYPYYNIAEFKAKTNKYKKYVEPYLLCLAQKYKFKLEIVTGQKKWPTYYIKDQKEYDDQKKNLDELKEVLDGFQNLPNTFLPYDNNPAIWNLIAKDSEEYLNCLSKIKNPQTSKVVDLYLKEIAKSKLAAENFNGGSEGLYKSGSYEWMLRAVSDTARKDFIKTQKGWNTNEEAVKKINDALDDLQESCFKKIKMLKIEDSYFKYHDTSLENLMKAYLKNVSALKIYKIGISDNNWLIEKNNIGIPLFKYKRGQMFVKNNSDDHNLCKGLFFEIRQDYAGGGTYASPRINNYHEELYGCP